MIKQKFRLPKYNWTIYAFYVVTRPNADEIMDALESIGCRGKNLQSAWRNLTSGRLDTGLTYSNEEMGETVVVFAKTSCAREFQQSYQHEIGHAKNHIAKACGISQHGEEIQYIGDDIVEATWGIAHELLCDCCRHKTIKR